MKFKLIILPLTFLLFQSIAFSHNILVIPPRANTSDSNIVYMEYAVSDILYKNLNIFSKSSVILDRENKLDYQATKGQITRIQKEYDVDIVITYSVQKYKTGYTLDAFIYSIENKKIWYEYIFYSSEESFYKSINNFIENIYIYGKIELINKKNSKLTEDIYLALIVYYNDIINSEGVLDYSLYKRFTTFHENNLFVAIDYLINFMDDKSYKSEYSKVIKELENILGKNNHYINYIYAYIYYDQYKKFGLSEDILYALKHIERSIEENNKNFTYQNLLGDIYLIKNDYENSINAYKNALTIYSHDKNALNNLIFIYMKDVEKYTEEIIEYSKILIEQNEIKEDMLETLVSIYKNAGDNESELHYLNMLLEYINKEIARIKAYQLGAIPLYKYTLKQKNVEKQIKAIEERIFKY